MPSSQTSATGADLPSCSSSSSSAAGEMDFSLSCSASPLSHTQTAASALLPPKISACDDDHTAEACEARPHSYTPDLSRMASEFLPMPSFLREADEALPSAGHLPCSMMNDSSTSSAPAIELPRTPSTPPPAAAAAPPSPTVLSAEQRQSGPVYAVDPDAPPAVQVAAFAGVEPLHPTKKHHPKLSSPRQHSSCHKKHKRHDMGHLQHADASATGDDPLRGGRDVLWGHSGGNGGTSEHVGPRETEAAVEGRTSHQVGLGVPPPPVSAGHGSPLVAQPSCLATFESASAQLHSSTSPAPLAGTAADAGDSITADMAVQGGTKGKGDVASGAPPASARRMHMSLLWLLVPFIFMVVVAGLTAYLKAYYALQNSLDAALHDVHTTLQSEVLMAAEELMHQQVVLVRSAIQAAQRAGDVAALSSSRAYIGSGAAGLLCSVFKAIGGMPLSSMLTYGELPFTAHLVSCLSDPSAGVLHPLLISPPANSSSRAASKGGNWWEPQFGRQPAGADGEASADASAWEVVSGAPVSLAYTLTFVHRRGPPPPPHAEATATTSFMTARVDVTPLLRLLAFNAKSNRVVTQTSRILLLAEPPRGGPGDCMVLSYSGALEGRMPYKVQDISDPLMKMALRVMHTSASARQPSSISAVHNWTTQYGNATRLEEVRKAFVYKSHKVSLWQSRVRTSTGLSLQLLTVVPQNVLRSKQRMLLECAVAAALVAGSMIAAIVVLYLTLVTFVQTPLNEIAYQLNDTHSLFALGDSSAAERGLSDSPDNRSPSSYFGLTEVLRIRGAYDTLRRRIREVSEYVPPGLFFESEVEDQPAVDPAQSMGATAKAWLRSIHNMSNVTGRSELSNFLAGSANNSTSEELVQLLDLQGSAPDDGGVNGADGRSPKDSVIVRPDGTRVRRRFLGDSVIEVIENTLDSSRPDDPRSLSASSGVWRSNSEASAPHLSGSELPSTVNQALLRYSINRYTKRICSVLSIHIDYQSRDRASAHAQEVMDAVVSAAKRFGGTFDIFVPEMLYISFGSRQISKDHALLATQCGIAIYNELSPGAREDATFVVDSGVFFIGVCGVAERKGFVLWGRPASELFFSHQQRLGCRFIIMDTAAPLLVQHFNLLPIDVVEISDKKNVPPVGFYGLFPDFVRGDPWWDFSSAFKSAFADMIAMKYDRALSKLTQLIAAPHFPLYAVKYLLLCRVRIAEAGRRSISSREFSRQVNEINVTYAREFANGRSFVAPYGFLLPRYFTDSEEAGDDLAELHLGPEEVDVTQDQRQRTTRNSSAGTQPSAGVQSLTTGGRSTPRGSLGGGGSDRTLYSGNPLLTLSPAAGGPLFGDRAAALPMMVCDDQSNYWHRSAEASTECSSHPLFLGISLNGAIAALAFFDISHFTEAFMQHSANATSGVRHAALAASSRLLESSIFPTTVVPSGAAADLASTEIPLVTDAECMKRMSGWMRTLYHENIVEYISYAFPPPYKFVCVINEYVPGGTLREFVQRYGRHLPLSVCRRYCVSILRGLEYLHCERGIVHGLLRPENIMTGVDGSCKMKGMAYQYSWATGSTELLEQVMEETACYNSPEVNARQCKTAASDIFSFGLILLEMLTGEPPWRWTASAQGHVRGANKTGLLAVLSNNELFLESLDQGELELTQYGSTFNKYNMRFDQHSEERSASSRGEADTTGRGGHTAEDKTNVEEAFGTVSQQTSPASSAANSVRLEPSERHASDSQRLEKPRAEDMIPLSSNGNTQLTRNSKSSGYATSSASTSLAAAVAGEGTGADAAMLQVLENCLAYDAAERKTAPELLKMLSNM